MQLKRVLGLRTVVSTSAGLTFATSCFVAAAQVAGFLAGDSAWLAILVAGVLVLLAAAAFSELSGQYPSAAGLRLYLLHAFGDTPALVLSLFYMAVVTAVVGTETYVLSHVLNHAIPAVPPLVWIVVMLAVATLMNLRGIKVAGHFQDIITYGLVAGLVAFGLLALRQNGFALRAPFDTSGAGGLFNAVAVGVFLFVAFEWVTPLAEEVLDPGLIPRGMYLAVGLLSVVYALFTLAMASTVPRSALTSPIPHILFGEQVLGRVGMWWMTLASLAASITTFNAGLITISRFMYGSAREGVLPSVFARISSRHLTPYAAIYALFAIALGVSALVYFTGRYLTLVLLGSATESLIYALAGAAVISLRRRHPDARRPWPMPRLPGESPRWPVLAVLTTVVFAVLAVGVVMQSWAVAAFMAVGLAASYAYVKLVVPGLRETHRAAQAARAAERSARGRAARARATEASSAPATGGPEGRPK